MRELNHLLVVCLAWASVMSVARWSEDPSAQLLPGELPYFHG